MIDITADVQQLLDVEHLFRQIGNQAPHAIRRAINHTGDKARTLVMRTLAKQAGVKYRDVRKIVTVTRANFDRGLYRIAARGTTIPLSHFGARQTKKGVSAAPWGKRRVFPHTFLWPRVHGRVFVRTGHKARMLRGPNKGRQRETIRQLWGPALPKELLKGETAAIFLATVRAELPARVVHEVAAILAGHAPRG